MNPDPHPVAAGVRRAVGIAALRRLRRLVDAEAAQERADTLWARRLGLGFLVAVGLLLLWLAWRMG